MRAGYLRDVGTGSTLTHQLRAEVMGQLDRDFVDGSGGRRSGGGGGASTSHPHAAAPDAKWLQPGALALEADEPPPLPQEDWGRLSSYPVSFAAPLQTLWSRARLRAGKSDDSNSPLRTPLPPLLRPGCPAGVGGGHCQDARDGGV